MSDSKYSKKSYRFYCEICNFIKITDGRGEQDLVEIKRCPIPGGIPVLNKESGETDTPKAIKQPRLFRCPRCGRGMSVRKISSTAPVQMDEDVDDALDQQENMINQIINKLDDVYGEDNPS